MKISVIIIAKNEEKHIAECIESVLNQTQKADEVILIVHNSTDRTQEIAERYPISVVTFTGPSGVIYARLEGLNHVNGDMIICIDGDSYAKENWIETMASILSNNNALVGSWIKFKGTVFGSVYNLFSRFLCRTKGKNAVFWIWGPSFAFWKKDHHRVKLIWEQSIQLSSRLRLTRNPEDNWLSLFMSMEEPIEVTNKTWVAAYTKETTSWAAIKRSYENKKDSFRILEASKKEILYIPALETVPSNV